MTVYSGWSGDCGGMKVYVARDEDEEVSELTELLPDSMEVFPLASQLLSVSPSRNALSLVFCDKDTISFTKCINHRTNSSDSNFFCAAFTYKEIL